MNVAAPSSTYRLQLHRDFTLDDAAALIPYLVELGVGAVYLSPVLQSTRGSAHGYDTTDVTRVDPERGGDAGLQALRDAAAEAGLGVVIDIVPNHLGIAAAEENPAWWDVLRRGQGSRYARWFDIDWSRPRILLPVLGDDPELSIVGDELRYFDHRFPLAPGSAAPGAGVTDVHARQHYELVHWSRGNTELNYRRFFAVTTLAGVRVEDPEVFAATHARVREWAAAGVAGLRIDHPDGLLDPGQYLNRLRELAPDAWITVEKVLEPGEKLEAAWPVAGTTGYDAMREVNGLFVDPNRTAELTEIYQRLTGDRLTIAQHIEAGKRMVVTELLPAEITRMAALVPAGPDGPSRVDVEAALAEVAIAFEVYRSYLPEGVEYLDHALLQAARRKPELALTIEVLRDRLHDPTNELAGRLQQLSGATMAKGIEDTAYYRYARFIALNEVGGNPDQVGLRTDDFHAAQALRAVEQPRSMTSLSTHDTKRSEDVRARLAVLAEIPATWAQFAEHFVAAAGLSNAPFAYFLAQTLVGTGPVDRDRLHAYAEKAMREANAGTTWTAPDADFEAAVHAAVDRAYDDPELCAAWDEIIALVTPAGWSNALGQKLVQLAQPGVPDVYQGTELWDDSLVDPDNRRPVDYADRRARLARLGSEPVTVDAFGAAKLLVTARGLRLRRERPELFEGYQPVVAVGAASQHLVGFDRGGVIAVATRLPLGLATSGGWADTAVELTGGYRDQLTDREWSGRVLVRDLLSDLPVALLVRG